MMGHGAPEKFHYGSAITGREANLIAGYEFDAQEGMLINKDVTGIGGGSDGTITGARQAFDRTFGRVLHFVRANGDQVVFTNTTSIANTGTVAMLFKCDIPGGGNTKYAFGATGGGRFFSIAVNAAGNLVTEVGNSGLQDSGVPILADKWYLVILAWENRSVPNHACVFVDGLLVDDYNMTIGASFATAYIGADSAGANNWEGSICEFVLLDHDCDADAVLGRYISYARRAQYTDYLRSAYVSPAAEGGVVGAFLSNTRWQFGDVNGRWQIVDAVINGLVEKAIRCTVAGQLYISAQHLGIPADSPEMAYGTHEFWLNKNPGNTLSIFFISDGTNPAIATGYDISISNTERLYLRRQTGGVALNLMRTIAAYFPTGVWTKISPPRRFDGQFTTLINGAPIPAASLDLGTNPVTDNTHTDGSVIIIDLDAGDEFFPGSKRFGEIV